MVKHYKFCAFLNWSKVFETNGVVQLYQTRVIHRCNAHITHYKWATGLNNFPLSVVKTRRIFFVSIAVVGGRLHVQCSSRKILSFSCFCFFREKLSKRSQWHVRAFNCRTTRRGFQTDLPTRFCCNYQIAGYIITYKHL